MAGNLMVKVGEAVPVALQIADGNEAQFPRAEIRDNGGTLLTTLNLDHEASGLYVPSTPYLMPDVLFIKVTYIVYSDAGHTTESTLYLRDVDVFSRATMLQFIEDIEGGDWERDGTQMIFRKPGGAEVARFNLFKFDGSPATESDTEVAKRERV